MAKRRKPIESTTESPIKCSDLGTPELQRRGIDVAYNDQMGMLVGKVRTQQPIDLYYNRGYLEEHQYQAARELQRDAELAGMLGHIRSSANFERGDIAGHLVDKKIDATTRVNEIIFRVVSGVERAVIMWVIMDDGYMQDLKTYEVFNSVTGEVLRDGLERVAKFYGLRS